MMALREEYNANGETNSKVELENKGAKAASTAPTVQLTDVKSG
jgi:hypothetical protein